MLKKKLSSRQVVHRAIHVDGIEQKQQVSLRYAEMASQQVSKSASQLVTTVNEVSCHCESATVSDGLTEPA
jgi:hypothetical protein